MRHLLAIEDLDRADIERIIERAESFAEVGRRDIKKVPTLRGRTIVNLFYESSTRTSSSFELAAKRLSADVVSIKSAGSAVDKGESLKDTVATLSAYEPAAIVIRSPAAPAPPTSSPAGPTPPSSTPATASTSTPARRSSTSSRCAAASASLEGKQHLDRRRRPPQPGRPLLRRSPSRTMGAEVTVCGPPTLIPRGIERRWAARSPTTSTSLERGRRRLRPADAARADERELRPLAARVRRQLPDRRAPARPAPAADAPRPGQPRRRALARGDRRRRTR